MHVVLEKQVNCFHLVNDIDLKFQILRFLALSTCLISETTVQHDTSRISAISSARQIIQGLMKALTSHGPLKEARQINGYF